jgi:beta-N-acetylhexosaminidase
MEKSLSLEHAVGQKLLLAFEGKERPSDGILQAMQQGMPAGVTLFRAFNVDNPVQVRELTGSLQAAASVAGLPRLLIAVDQEGGQLMAVGGATPFPGNMALGATGSPELAHRTGLAMGRELAAMGINVNYAPVCDVNVNPRNPGVGTRSFGDVPARVAEMSAAMVAGLQAAGVAATAKHFPGLGDAATDPHYDTPLLVHDRERLRRVELPPFEAAIHAGARLVMTAHVALPALNDGLDIPATLSDSILKQLLRKELGFEGPIVSDAMDMKAIRQGPGLAIDAIAAVKAGVDLLLLIGDIKEQQMIFEALMQAVRRGLLSREQIFASAQKILELKKWLAAGSQPDLEVVNSQEHRDLAAEIAARSVTLVRDSAGQLPLRLAADANIAVVIPQPRDLTPADTSSYEVPRLAEAMRQYHPQIDEVMVPINPLDADISAVREKADGYNLVVMGTINGDMHPGQASLVETLRAGETPVIVTALRTPYDLTVFPNVQTYICTYSILEPSMRALAATLWGEIEFQGRLPVKIPTTVR